MPTKIEETEYYSLQEIAEMVAVSRQTLWRWRQEGKMPHGRSFRGRSLLFSESEVTLIKQRAHEMTIPSSKDKKGIFLDNAATTKPLPEVVLAMEKAMGEFFGNAASAHERGLIMRKVIGEARESVSRLCGANPEDVYFTSGCTESNNWVLFQRNDEGRSPWKKIVTTRIEHSSIKNAVLALESFGTEVIWIDTPKDGRFTEKELIGIPLTEETLVAIQWANNETGILNEVLAIAEKVKSKGAFFLCDAAQAFGETPINFRSSKIDYLTVSSHKIHGPQGVGAIMHNPGAPLFKFLHGGTQEGGKRPGTENSLGISGFGTASAIRKTNFGSIVDKCKNLKIYLESELNKVFNEIEIVGSEEQRLCHITNFRIPRLDGQSVVAQLNALNIYVSQSSACTNMKPEPSYVLAEMGYSEEEAYEAIRVGVSEENSIDEIEKFVLAISEISRNDIELRNHQVKLEA